MKRKSPHFIKVLDVFLTIIIIVWEIIELTAVPLFFTIIGILNGFGYIYYLCTIGGYIFLILVLELIAYTVNKLFGKKFETLLTKLLDKITSKK